MNASKCQIIVKEASKIKILWLYEGTAVEIVDGCRILGSEIGNGIAYETFNLTTAKNFSNLLKKFVQVAKKTSPQNTCACLTKSMQQKIIFVSKTTPNSQMRKPTSKPTYYCPFLTLRNLKVHSDCFRYQPVRRDLTSRSK